MSRPTKLTDEVKSKMEYIAALDGSVEEMAFYCDVARQTIYNWLEADKDFLDRIERLRQRPILAARKRVVEGVEESYANAVDYLKKKRKKEFTDSLDLTTAGEKITGVVVLPAKETQDYGNEENNNQENHEDK